MSKYESIQQKNPRQPRVPEPANYNYEISKAPGRAKLCDESFAWE